MRHSIRRALRFTAALTPGSLAATVVLSPAGGRR